MAKNLKLKIKNIQLGTAAGLDKLKVKKPAKPEKATPAPASKPKEPVEEPRRLRAKTKSAFAPKEESEMEEIVEETPPPPPPVPEVEEEIIEEVIEEEPVVPFQNPLPTPLKEETPPPREEIKPVEQPPKKEEVARVKLGPTGRHIKDLLPPPKKEEREAPKQRAEDKAAPQKKEIPKTSAEIEEEEKRKGKKVREFKDVKPPKREMRPFDARDRKGLGGDGEEERWRKRRAHKERSHVEEQIVRPTELKVRLPISIKDLAQEMKLKAAELIQKLFMQGITNTLNDLLDDETLVQYLGAEFGCQITIDTTEEKRLQVTHLSVQEEIAGSPQDQLQLRPPIVTFMGHVDHGKTSLIDAIRKTKIAAGEAGAITQHMGAFRCKTAVGDLTILDTPGHEAFSAMRARGALATDIVVLVVAGDEGMREQTFEALEHARGANVTIVVALNKSDKPNFNAENIYRQLAEANLLPEAWGGQTITVNTSAQTGEGIPQLLEMLALQTEVLELNANPKMRARGVVLESELHKGLGSVATVLIQNGSLHHGDAIVINHMWGRVKTMRDDLGHSLKTAGPSTPVEITGLSGLPKAGDLFFVVKNEKEAREIAEGRVSGMKQKALQQKKVATLDTLLQKDAQSEKKFLRIVLRADVQGSLEALKASLLKIHSTKAEADIIFAEVGEISESDVELAAASNAVILGFHCQIESNAATLIKEKKVTVRLHDIIYHAIDDIKALMKGLLDKIPEEKETGKAEVKALFKASALGNIAGCIVTEGLIHRNHRVRVERAGKVIWKGAISSLKRVKDDVKEVRKGLECGILLDGYNQLEVGDILSAYEIIYHEQEL